MTSARKVKAMIVIALAMVFPFALFEAYLVFRFGVAEPYSYFVSAPLSVVSFVILQLAIGYGFFKGWTACEMRSNYAYLALWLLSLLTLILLPQFFSNVPFDQSGLNLGASDRLFFADVTKVDMSHSQVKNASVVCSIDSLGGAAWRC